MYVLEGWHERLEDPVVSHEFPSFFLIPWRLKIFVNKTGFISNQIRLQYDFQLCKYIHTYVSSNIKEDKESKEEIVWGKRWS